MRIGKYIELSDLTASDTAERLHIDQTPTQQVVDALTNVVKFIYDPVCDHLGTVRVNSGYRSKELNQAIGGSTTSQHCKGEALDLSFNGIKSINTNSTIFYYILHNLDFDQLIWEFGNDQNPQWVHVSFSTKHNRKDVLKSVKVAGRTSYQHFNPTNA